MIPVITIKEIAKLAGVSTATVSNALNSRGRVGEEVRQRVLKIVEQYQYKPNLVAKNLREKAVRTIGVIVEDIVSFNVPPIIDGINAYAEEHGIHVLLHNLRLSQKIDFVSADQRKYKRLANESAEVLLQNQADGLIYIPISVRDLTGLIECGNHTVVYTYGTVTVGEEHPKSFSVGMDEEGGAYHATKELVQAGHKRIACILGNTESLSTQERLKGFQKCLMDNDRKQYPQYLKDGDWTFLGGYQAGRKIFGQEIPPTAVFCMSDVMACGVIKAVRELGLSIPMDVSVIGFDNLEFCNYLDSPLTTVHLPLKQIGYEAARCLYEEIIAPVKNRQNVMLPCSIKVRNSISTIKG